jgi:ABC-type transport system involved in cytochrome bd biosynthesis fused ATPase/permease subunit
MGRRAERGALDRLIEAVRAGESRALVVHGEPGVGKTALLEYLARRASDCGAGRAAGVQSEMELAFAALHQLCAPMLDRLEALPVPQRDALRTAFAISPGPELIEAAARSGMSETAAGAHHRLAEMAGANGTDWVAGIEVRSRAAERG